MKFANLGTPFFCLKNNIKHIRKRPDMYMRNHNNYACVAAFFGGWGMATGELMDFQKFVVEHYQSTQKNLYWLFMIQQYEGKNALTKLYDLLEEYFDG